MGAIFTSKASRVVRQHTRVYTKFLDVNRRFPIRLARSWANQNGIFWMKASTILACTIVLHLVRNHRTLAYKILISACIV